LSEIPIFVPSKGRPDSSTARLLAEAGLAFTVVVEPQDERRYSRWPTVALDRNDQGIAYVRSWIKANAASDWYWMLDDDITAFYETANGRNKRADAAKAIRGAEKFFAQDKSVAQAALEYQQFAWSSKKPVKHGGYCDVAVCTHAGRTAFCSYRPEVSLKEDRDFTLQVLASGYRTARVCAFSFAAPKNGSNGGGLQAEYAKAGREAAASLKMCQLWPGVCSLFTKPDGRKDVKISWRMMSKARR
jgi:hypothetical protein